VVWCSNPNLTQWYHNATYTCRSMDKSSPMTYKQAYAVLLWPQSAIPTCKRNSNRHHTIVRMLTGYLWSLLCNSLTAGTANDCRNFPMIGYLSTKHHTWHNQLVTTCAQSVDKSQKTSGISWNVNTLPKTGLPSNNSKQQSRNSIQLSALTHICFSSYGKA